MIGPKTKFAGALSAALALALMIAGPADARRGGSFGSRGSRTYSAPRSTSLSPGYTAPVQRSMTQRPAFSPSAPAYGQQQNGFGQQRRPGFLGGFGGGLLGGVLAGGLIGGMMGHGFGGGGWGGGMGGGGGGFLAILIQLALVGGIVWLGLKLFRRRQPAAAVVDGPWGQAPSTSAFNAGTLFGGGNQAPQPPPTSDFNVSQSDRDAFTALLIEVQDAFGKEDYGRLRERTTPEIMSYLAEELSQNATQGRRNDVTATHLIQMDISEAWREDGADYATAALRYESIDIMRNRTSGEVLSGDAAKPTETTEVWTFVRTGGGPWKLSAIQEV